MAGILNKYFNDPPKSVGQSTFEYDKNSALSADNLKYKTLIGSVTDAKWGQQDSDRQNDPALLMHAAELYWGDATFVDNDANSNLSEVTNLTKNGRIRTTHDIIAILEYLMANVGKSSFKPTLKLNSSSLLWNNNDTKKTIEASVTFGDPAYTTWELSNVGNFSLSAASGQSIEITPLRKVNIQNDPNYKNAPSALGNLDTKVEKNGNVWTIKVTFNVTKTSCKDSLNYNDTLTAKYENLSQICTLTYDRSISEDISGLSEKTDGWIWSIENISNIDGLSIADNGVNSKILTITNNTNEAISLEEKTITVKNENSKSANITLSGSIEAKPEDKIYYWYSGQENPMEMDNIDPEKIAIDNEHPGWHYIGQEFNENSYTKGNELYKYKVGVAILGEEDGYGYLALPGKNLRPRNGNGGSVASDEDDGKAWQFKGKKTIENVEYRIYQSVADDIVSLPFNIYVK